MSNSDFLFDEDYHGLTFDPKILEEELAEETRSDPLDDLDNFVSDATDTADKCDMGLELLQGDHQEQMEGLRIFCQHRDPRSVLFLLPLLKATCPIQRMSAVCALGRNPSPLAVETLLSLLHYDSNGYIRKAVAWTLGKNYSRAPVLNPLIKSLRSDIAAVRLRACSSIADAGCVSQIQADLAAVELLLTICIDNEPAVRSGSIWSLSRIYGMLLDSRKQEAMYIINKAALYDPDYTVRDEARMMLELLEDATLLDLNLADTEEDWLN
uniref:HEAT repeat domain-containing protein n=1 Tax=Paulinella micropora TaxID=1928728 RepID=A0A385HZN0_9EUKA|nr:hypothetical protein PMNZ_173 [Paulinella micropora]AXY63127.1 hypothetical protein PMNZ_173 [Paulinella micropora]